MIHDSSIRSLLGLACVGLAVLGAPGAAAQKSLFDQGNELLQGVLEADPTTAGLGSAEIADGLKEALQIGTERVTAALGRVDGFNLDPEVHIPLPESLQTVQTALATVGMAGLADDLELRLNRAAEAAVPEAKALFWQAIERMTLKDAQGILNGPDDAATRYFKRRMTKPLTKRFTPIVDQQLAEAGAVQAYDDMLGSYQALPFVADVKTDLTGYAVDRTLAGMFLLLGREEAAIRQDPARRTTELLQKVFGAG